ncbi:rab-protein geranylgeranyltransferase [Moniliophthora roreri MCA 2997]|uniref:Geranylgeranyl transferase type-2 subunit alpha n=1 Tax=Moniliophthora roreri (strain MCA 2997) TaxID=1381753 RepID=V2X768_MONRO|nr:rab-protein geranylgeranyltransferase [Moniliophthora roreri MCA 2997]
MHSIRRVRQPQEFLEAKKKREQAKITEYLALTEDVLTRKKNKECSKESLDLTTRLLGENVEFYTIWNYRRNILLHGIFPASTPAEINDLLLEDLSMTTTFLKMHPKIYWIWNHRRWCLENVPDGPGTIGDDQIGWKKASWNKELLVVEKMLDADPRNFHAWSYRRYILAGMPIPRSEISELAYTTKKIESSFSNFSAWHQRSKVLSSLWAQGMLGEEQSKEAEYDLVKNAIFTDPNDQSAWIYHRWLVGSAKDKNLLEREISVIQELLDEQPDSRWCMDSLVHYKRLLVQADSSVDKEALISECVRLLGELRTVDPGRRRRYDEIG